MGDKDVQSAISRSVRGVGLLVVLKLFLKASQIVLNFLVIRAVEPGVYGSGG